MLPLFLSDFCSPCDCFYNKTILSRKLMISYEYCWLFWAYIIQNNFIHFVSANSKGNCRHHFGSPPGFHPCLRDSKESPPGSVLGWSSFTVYRVWVQIFYNSDLLYKSTERELLKNVWRMIYLLSNIAKIAILEICWYF